MARIVAFRCVCPVRQLRLSHSSKAAWRKSVSRVLFEHRPNHSGLRPSSAARLAKIEAHQSADLLIDRLARETWPRHPESPLPSSPT